MTDQELRQMWHTPQGLRALTGAEAAVIRQSLDAIVEQTRLDGEIREAWEYGVQLFDRLELPQRIAILAEVGSALLREDVPAPEFTAVREATVAALYENLSQRIEIELDQEADMQEVGGDPFQWRRTVRDAYLAVCQFDDYWKKHPNERPEDGIPAVESHDRDEWEWLIECLKDDVLWDDDWACEPTYLDADPVIAVDLRDRLSIPRDYYTTPAPDPTPRQLDQACGVLSELLGRPVRFAPDKLETDPVEDGE